MRSAGHSSTAAAAYRTASRIEDSRTGLVYDYTPKRGVLFAEIVGPEHAPVWVEDRSALWNAVEQAEKKSNSRVARDIDAALPHELDKDAWIWQSRSHAEFLATRYGVAVDYAIHAPVRGDDPRNTHVHFLLTTREMTADGLGKKVRVLDDLKTGPQEIHVIRAQWAELTNEALRRAGRPERVDHRSYAEQGVEREATQHMGKDAHWLAQQGVKTEIGEKNRAIAARNQQREMAGQQATQDAEIWDRDLAGMEKEQAFIDAAIALEEKRLADEERQEQQRIDAEQRQQQEAKRQQELAEKRAGAWANSERARMQGRVHGEQITLGREHTRQAQQEETRLNAFYGPTLDKTTAQIAEVQQRMEKGGVWYRLSGRQKADRQELEALARTQDDAQQRRAEALGKATARQQAEKNLLQARHDRELQADEKRIEAMLQRGLAPDFACKADEQEALQDKKVQDARAQEEARRLQAAQEQARQADMAAQERREQARTHPAPEPGRQPVTGIDTSTLSRSWQEQRHEATPHTGEQEPSLSKTWEQAAEPSHDHEGERSRSRGPPRRSPVPLRLLSPIIPREHVTDMLPAYPRLPPARAGPQPL